MLSTVNLHSRYQAHNNISYILFIQRYTTVFLLLQLIQVFQRPDICKGDWNKENAMWLDTLARKHDSIVKVGDRGRTCRKKVS